MDTEIAPVRICAADDCSIPSPMGTGRYCYGCKIDRNREYHRANLERLESNAMEKRYGITMVEYDAILISQNGVCAICGGTSEQFDKRNGRVRKMHVDHDHRTNIVRGILCHRCNTAIGSMYDSPELLLRAVEYLTFERTPHG